MTSAFSTLDGTPVDLTMDRHEREELLATVERRLADARTRQDRPAVEALRLQAGIVRKTLETVG